MRSIYGAVMLLLPLLAGPGGALGADDGHVPPAARPDGAWINVLAAVVFVVGTLLVAFKNARRTHLD